MSAREDTALRSPTRGRSATTIGALVLGLLAALAVLREVLAPDAPMVPDPVQLLGPASQRTLARPFWLIAELSAQLVALSWVARWSDRRRMKPTGFVVLVCAASVVFGTVCAIALKYVSHVPSPLAHALVSGPLAGIQTLALWFLVFRYPQIADDARVRALETEKLRQEADLSRLREHLQPHFLRNTLNAIAASVDEDPTQARELLAALGDLLSESIESDEPARSLRDELEWLKRYAEILEARYRSDLRFEWQLDPRAEATIIPRLLLQPLLENAIEHGALARDGRGLVSVRTERTAAGVSVVVEDNGPGYDRARPDGIGLRLVRQRLALECSGSVFRIESSANGTRAIVELP